jgi:hypothetical protein
MDAYPTGDHGDEVFEQPTSNATNPLVLFKETSIDTFQLPVSTQMFSRMAVLQLFDHINNVGFLLPYWKMENATLAGMLVHPALRSSPLERESVTHSTKRKEGANGNNTKQVDWSKARNDIWKAVNEI